MLSQRPHLSARHLPAPVGACRGGEYGARICRAGGLIFDISGQADRWRQEVGLKLSCK
jgi:hypothetical protein